MLSPRVSLRTVLMFSLGLNVVLVSGLVVGVLLLPGLGPLGGAPKAWMMGAMLEKRLGAKVDRYVADPERRAQVRRELKSATTKLGAFVEANSTGKKKSVALMVLGADDAETSRGAAEDLSYYLAHRELMVEMAKSVLSPMTPDERQQFFQSVMSDLP